VSIELEMVRREGYLEFTASGEFDLEDAKRAFNDLVRRWTAERVPNVLIDVRRVVMSVPMSLEQRFAFAQHAAQAGIDARARGMAANQAVFLATERQLDARRFGMVVALNRGAKVRVTADQAEALAWLAEEQAGQPNA
jgi:hypothetical protein